MNLKASIETVGSCACEGAGPNTAAAITARIGILLANGAAKVGLNECVVQGLFFGMSQPARGVSITASGCSPCTKLTLVMPRNFRSSPSGTFMGPGAGAEPGSGCGNAVERAV